MKGFRNFLLRGNVIDLAVGIVIGAAFTSVVQGFVKDFLNPLIGLASGHNKDFNSQSFTVHGQMFKYGDFIGDVISFVLVAAVVYYLIVLPMNTLHARFFPKKQADAPVKECPECLTTIPAAATRCSACTSPQPSAEVSFPKQ